jgi:hypothetical protein
MAEPLAFIYADYKGNCNLRASEFVWRFQMLTHVAGQSKGPIPSGRFAPVVTARRRKG